MQPMSINAGDVVPQQSIALEPAVVPVILAGSFRADANRQLLVV